MEEIANSNKTMKKYILVSAFLVFSLLLTGCGNQTQQNSNDSQADSSSTKSEIKADKIEVVDFHGTNRCYSCEILEKYARETLEENFQNELLNGKITFRSINGELPENRDMVIKYQARGSSLFINTITGGKDNIEEEVTVWRLIGDEQKFKTYFKGKLENYLQ